jgi:hypothetical protein
MKKLYTLLTAVILTASAFAQAPEKMSYQAVVRDAGNALVTSQAVGMQISILQGSVSGTAVYVETQTPTTDINGLISIDIGSGSVVSGTFTTIDWSSGPYFIKTETDPTGGTTYTITGTSQLLSVPYALHAKTADSIVGGVSLSEIDPVFGVSIASGITASDTANWNNHTTQIDSTDIANLGYIAGGHYIGELFGGGIVCYVYDNGVHGLIASLDDLDGGNGVAWSGDTTTNAGTANGYYNGLGNTAAMVALDATANKAGTLCDSYSNGGYTDWYLPALWELNLLYNSAYAISVKLANDGDPTTSPIHLGNVAPINGRYWSSTESDSGAFAKYPYFYFGHSSAGSKTSSYRVRAVRAF